MSYVLWAVSYSFPVFIVARIVGGISKGNVSLGAAIVTDITTPAQRSKGMVSLCVNVVFIYSTICCTTIFKHVCICDVVILLLQPSEG